MQNELLTQQLNILLSKEVLSDKWTQVIEKLIIENRALRRMVDIAIECDVVEAFTCDMDREELLKYEEEYDNLGFTDWLIYVTEKHLEKEDENNGRDAENF